MKISSAHVTVGFPGEYTYGSMDPAAIESPSYWTVPVEVSISLDNANRYYPIQGNGGILNFKFDGLRADSLDDVQKKAGELIGELFNKNIDVSVNYK